MVTRYLPLYAMTGFAALALAAPTLSAREAAPDQAASPPAFAMCKACHTVTKGGSAGLGPNLSGVVGATAGGKAGFAYSPAMKASKLKWTRANLDKFLADPAGTVPKTKMMMPGTKDPAKRKAILDYLETLK
jgi:cytochrome c